MPELVSRLGVARRAAVAPFHTMDVLSAAARRQRTHGDVISLAPGQPSSPAPAPVRAAAAEALERNVLGYTEQLGILELPEALPRPYAPRPSPDRRRDAQA